MNINNLKHKQTIERPVLGDMLVFFDDLLSACVVRIPANSKKKLMNAHHLFGTSLSWEV